MLLLHQGLPKCLVFYHQRILILFLCTSGILVEPPTIMHSSNSAFLRPESLIQFSIGLIDLTIKSSIKLSNLALVRFMNMFFGPCCVIVIYGKLIDV